MKQNKQRGSIELVIGITFAFAFASFLMVTANNADIQRLEKYDTCLTQAITVNADPNDTTERTLKLTECMDK